MAPATPSRRAPIEAKTQAAGLAGVVSGVVIWLLGQYAFKGSTVPAGLQSLIYAAVPGLLAFGAAYLAPHTPRPAPPAVIGGGGGGGLVGGSPSPLPPPPASQI